MKRHDFAIDYSQLTINHFKRHIQAHISRCVHLAMAARILFPRVFGHLPLKMVIDFISLHDQAKLSPELLGPLFKFFSRNAASCESLGSNEAKEFAQLIQEINSRDHSVALGFFARSSFGVIDPHGPLATDLLRMEKLVDLVDRGQDEMANYEFRKKMIKASEYLISPVDRFMALILEKDYSLITAELGFISFLPMVSGNNNAMHPINR